MVLSNGINWPAPSRIGMGGVYRGSSNTRYP